MRTLHARRVLGADKRGSSGPVVVETEEPGERQFTKLRKENVIRIENNRHVSVPDMDRLMRYASTD